MVLNDAILKITYVKGAFSNEEMDEIDDILTHFGKVRRNYYLMDAIGEPMTSLIIFGLGVVTGGIATGFFNAMGSDIYQKLKRNVADILSRKKHTKEIIFSLFTNTTEVKIISLPSSVKEVENVFDTINVAKDIAIDALAKDDTPKMTEAIIKYEDGWTIDYGAYRSQKDFFFYTYDENTGTWILDESYFKKNGKPYSKKKSKSN